MSIVVICGSVFSGSMSVVSVIDGSAITGSLGSVIDGSLLAGSR